MQISEQQMYKIEDKGCGSGKPVCAVYLSFLSYVFQLHAYYINIRKMAMLKTLKTLRLESPALLSHSLKVQYRYPWYETSVYSVYTFACTCRSQKKTLVSSSVALYLTPLREGLSLWSSLVQVHWLARERHRPVCLPYSAGVTGMNVHVQIVYMNSGYSNSDTHVYKREFLLNHTNHPYPFLPCHLLSSVILFL